MSKSATEQPTLEMQLADPKVALAKQPDPVSATSVLETIARLATTPNLNIDVVERLLAMQREVMAEQRKAEFHAALARAQAAMPKLTQDGIIDYGSGKAKIPYAKLESVDEVIRPIYSSEGFAVKWNSRPVPNTNLTEVSGEFTHSGGHSETISIALPPDSGGGKNGVQAAVGTISYGKRVLLKMFFHLIEKNTDMDGADNKPITQDEADTLRAKITEVNGNMQGFLKLMKVERIEDIWKCNLDRAYGIIETKRRNH